MKLPFNGENRLQEVVFIDVSDIYCTKIVSVFENSHSRRAHMYASTIISTLRNEKRHIWPLTLKIDRGTWSFHLTDAIRLF